MNNISSLLLHLPASLGRHILSKWLSVKAVGLLDVAFCNHCNRSSFLDILDNSETSDVETPFYGGNYFLRIHWMNLRNVKCSSFVLHTVGTLPDDKLAMLTSYVIRNAACLQRIKMLSNQYTVINWLMELLATHRSALTELSVPADYCPPTSAETVQWHEAMLRILQNSAHTLTSSYVGCPKQWWWLLSGKISLPALLCVNVVACDDEDLTCICQAAPNLLKIELVKPRCTSIGISMIEKHCRKLVSFVYTGARVQHLPAGASSDAINLDEGLAALAAGCTKLKHLVLTSAGVTDYGLGAIATHCTQLEEFTISYNAHVTDAPLITLAHTAGGHLKVLCLDGCALITGTGLVAIATHCTALHTLRIHEAKSPLQLTETNFMLAIPHFKSLKTLSLCYSKLNDAMLKMIDDHMPMLECFKLYIDWLHRAFTSEGLQNIRRPHNIYRF